MENTSSAAATIWNKLRGSRNNNNMSPSSSSTESNTGSSSSPVVAGASAALVSKTSPDELEPREQSATAHYKFANIQVMTTVTKSPYESNQSAEVGEPLFERLKLLLLSREELEGEVFEMAGAPTLTVQDETNKIFGEVLAAAVVKAHHVIGKSGMLFSPPWLEHKQCKIRGVQCGWISKPTMLLLLQEQRFARAPEATLNSLMNSMGVLNIFFDALKEWKLEDPRLVSNAPSLHFASKKQQCLKCVIFIARVYRCSKVLHMCDEGDEVDFQEEEPGLFAKAQQCLEILKENVKVHPKRLEEYESTLQQEDRRKKYLLNLAESENSRRQELAAKPQKKRKRESGTLTIQSTGSSISSATFRDAAVDVPEASIVGESQQPDTNGTHPSPEAADPPSPSVSVEELLALSEKQFKILRKTLKKRGREIKKTRDEIREEVRAEIMEEFGLNNQGARRTDSTTKRRKNGKSTKK
jgi:hypothetical protein